MVELWFCFLGEVNRHTEAAHFEAKLSPVEIHYCGAEVCHFEGRFSRLLRLLAFA
jgi:hypothetical protein